MKKAFFIIVAICLFASCDSQNQPADELIVGKWKVYKQTITGHFYNEQGDPVQGLLPGPLRRPRVLHRGHPHQRR